MPCDSPFFVLPKAGIEKVPVPCGKCPPCKLRRVNGWVFRLLQEDKISSSAHFLTVTYDTRHVPISENGFMTLNKSDFQLYMKRLRKLCPDFVLKYYACGEYGENYSRPHYHAIVFNCPDTEFFAKAWSLDGTQFGSVHVGTVSSDSIAYCLKYIDKDSFREKRPRHSRDDRQKEFSLQSKSLGSGYFSDPAIVAYHKADLSRNYVTRLSGHRVAMPRYYREKIFSDLELDSQRVIICNSLAQVDADAFAAHLNSSRVYSYPDKLDFERQGRLAKFRVGQKKRGDCL